MDGQAINPPVEWEDIEISCAWVNENPLNGGFVQPIISTSDMTFVNESAEAILAFIEKGLTTGPGIFQGMPISLQATDLVDGSQVVWDGFLDFLDNYEVLRRNSATEYLMVRTRLSRPDDFELFDQRLQALSFGYLQDKGLIRKRDMERILYVVQRIDRTNDALWISVSTFLIAKEVADAIKTLSGIIAEIASVTTTIPGVIKLILQIIYLGIMIILLLKFLTQLIALVIPVPKIQNVLSLKKMVEITVGYLGYRLETNLELDKVKYVPSRTPYYHQRGAGVLVNIIGGIDRTAVPNIQDYGYRCSDLFRLVMDLFNAQVRIDAGVVYIYTESDPFWRRNASYVLPDVLLDSYQLNVNRAVSTKLFGFQTDQSDGWTVEDFVGTNYEVDLASSQTIPQKYRLLKNLEQLRWPVALASRKTLIDDIEESIKKLAGIFGAVGKGAISALFRKLKRSNVLLGKAVGVSIPNGVMRVEGRHWSVPKLLYMVNGEIPANHRDHLSARAMYQLYHSYRSFAGPGFTGQRYIFKDVVVPFGLGDWIKVNKNKYFTQTDGSEGEFTKVSWKIGKDEATVSFEIVKPYIKTLTETTFEP